MDPLRDMSGGFVGQLPVNLTETVEKRSIPADRLGQIRPPQVVVGGWYITPQQQLQRGSIRSNLVDSDVLLSPEI